MNIFFSSVKSDIPTIDRKKNMKNIAPGSQSFSMIKLSDLAGFELAQAVDNDQTDLGEFGKLPLPRNVGVYESVKRREPPPFKKLDNSTRTYSSCAVLSNTKDSFNKSNEEEDSSGKSKRNSFTFKARSSVELNKIDGHNKHYKEDSHSTPTRVSIDGTNIPTFTRVQSLKTYGATFHNHNPSQGPEFPQTSFFYTTRNVVVHSQKPSAHAHIEPAGTPTTCTENNNSVGQRVIDRKCRPASVKSLPDKMMDKSSSTRTPSYNPNECHSTSVNRKCDPPDYSLTVTYSASTYPFHKKTTIV